MSEDKRVDLQKLNNYRIVDTHGATTFFRSVWEQREITSCVGGVLWSK